MKNHGSNANVQHDGCGALWSLASNDSNKVTIAEQEGIRKILSAMENHASMRVMVRVRVREKGRRL